MAIRLTAAERAAMGIPPSGSPKRKAKAAVELIGESVFRAMLLSHGITCRAEPEYVFAPPRKWRFDWAFIRFSQIIALEIQGGIFSGGRHVRGAALLDEYSKLNEAACLGIGVVYCTPQQVNSGEIFPVIKRALRYE